MMLIYLNVDGELLVLLVIVWCNCSCGVEYKYMIQCKLLNLCIISQSYCGVFVNWQHYMRAELLTRNCIRIIHWYAPRRRGYILYINSTCRKRYVKPRGLCCFTCSSDDGNIFFIFIWWRVWGRKRIRKGNVCSVGKHIVQTRRKFKSIFGTNYSAVTIEWQVE